MRQLKIEKSITSRDDAVMNRYMKEVAKEEMITADEEAELAMRIQRHDEHSHEAVDKLVRANLRFVISVAKQYQDLGLPLIDLINEGNLGMIRAAQGFDGSRGFKFITYAVWWIRQSILKALGDQGRIVRLPQNQVGNVTKLKNARDRFEQIHQRQPSPEELADELDMDLDKVIDIIQIDEPALRELLPLREQDRKAYLDWAVRSFRLVALEAKPTTQIHTHLCYSEFGQIIDAVAGLDADVTSIEAARSRMELLEDIDEKFHSEIGPGIYDIHSPRIPSVAEMAELIRAALKNVPVERLWVNPDCGLKTRGYEETEASLRNLVLARDEVRASL